jgi:hypothetical protein
MTGVSSEILLRKGKDDKSALFGSEEQSGHAGGKK